MKLRAVLAALSMATTESVSSMFFEPKQPSVIRMMREDAPAGKNCKRRTMQTLGNKFVDGSRRLKNKSNYVYYGFYARLILKFTFRAISATFTKLENPVSAAANVMASWPSEDAWPRPLSSPSDGGIASKSPPIIFSASART